jgi:hypothetical protein
MELACLKCKGKNPRDNCGRTYCPILAKTQAKINVSKDIKQDFQGSTPNIFIGKYGYPNLYVGLLSPPDVQDSTLHDAPKEWSRQNYNINSIIDLRSSLVNSRFLSNIKGTSKFLDIAQEIGMASKPVDIEVNLENKPKFYVHTDPYAAPMGPNASLAKAQVTSNPHIDRPVDKVVSDIDFKAVDAVAQLYQKGYDETFLTKILSAGNLGVKMQRKLVPTRWSITAVDDILAKQILDQVKYNEKIEYCAYFGSYLGNYYLVMLFPEIWSYELFEMYKPGASWNISKEFQYSTDYETYSGRTNYAENCAGGYYAARLAVLEKLKDLKKQGSALVLRVITPDYYCPLGVFVVREATRKALMSSPIGFASKELMLRYAQLMILKKFGFDITPVLRDSLMLKAMKEQRKIWEF